jgi:hypothetical protein
MRKPSTYILKRFGQKTFTGKLISREVNRYRDLKCYILQISQLWRLWLLRRSVLKFGKIKYFRKYGSQKSFNGSYVLLLQMIRKSYFLEPLILNFLLSDSKRIMIFSLRNLDFTGFEFLTSVIMKSSIFGHKVM